MAEKNINSRIVHKHDIESNWKKATGFIPKQGELIVYDIDSTYSYERIKIGDGVQNVNDLPFETNRGLKVVVSRDADSNNIVDKTYQEIYDAVQAGTYVYMVTGNTVYVDGYSVWPDTILWVSYCSDDSVIFTHNDGSSECEVEVNSSDEVSLYYNSSLPSKYSAGYAGKVLTVGEDGTVNPADFPDTLATTESVNNVTALVGDVPVAEQINIAIENLATIAKTGSWNDLNDKPFSKDGGLVLVMEETTHDFSSDLDMGFTPVIGTEYLVVVDEAQYFVTGSSIEIIAGEIYAPGFEADDGTFEAKGSFLCFFDFATHTVTVYQDSTVIHTLDEQFIPDTILRVSDAVGKLTDQNGEIFNDISYNVASRVYSHAEGHGTTASGESAHAEGNFTIASGDGAHAEGYVTYATGNGAHAEGRNTEASGLYSHAEGYHTEAASQSQHVEGEYNIVDESASDSRGQYVHIVGNGTSTSRRSNAHTLDWNGNAWYAGNIYVGAENKEIATQEYVDSAISAIPAPDVSGQIEIHNTSDVAHNDIRTAISNLNTLVGDTSVSSQINNAIANKVDKVDGKGLSTNDYTTAEKNKLSGIATGAEVNQNAFSNVVVGSTTIAADSKTDSLTIVAGDNVTLTPDATNDKLTIAATDTVYTHPTYTSKSAGLYKVTVDGTGHVSAATAVAKSDITALGIPAQDTTYSVATQSADGLMSFSDKTKLDGIETGANKTLVDSALSSTSTNPVQNKVVNTAIANLNTLVGDTSVSSQITDAIDGLNLSSTYIAATQKGAANGLAELDSNGKVPSTQLPSYVDDVLEYSAKSSFPSTGETGKIYVDTSANLTYRWSGSAYVEISPSIALGTTSSTAFRGDYGNTAYTHATAKGSAFTSGLYKITTNDQGHVTAATAVAKSDITGLGIPAQDTTYSAATTSAAGLMSATDKAKLDGIATGATKITVDSALSSTSTNPVQNKVVNTAITNLNTLVGDTKVSEQINTAIAPKLDAADAAWTQIYDSGAITSEVNSFSGINMTGYKSLIVAVKCVNTTNTTSTRAGAVIFTGSNSQDYAFNNIFSNLLKNGTTTSGAMAKFKIVDGFIICENAMRAIVGDGILSDTEGAGIDTLGPVSGGLIKCTNAITTMTISSAAQSADHYYGVGSRVVVWGCKI